MTMSKLGNLPSGNLCYIPKLALNYPCLSTVIWQVHVHLMMTPYWCYAWFLMLNLCPYFQTDYMFRRPQLSDQLILWKDTWTNLQTGLGWLVWEGSGIWWTCYSFLFIYVHMVSSSCFFCDSWKENWGKDAHLTVGLKELSAFPQHINMSLTQNTM